MKKAISYIVAIPLVILALIPPWNLKISTEVNSLFWLWMVLASGFLAFTFLLTKANVWIKLIIIYSFLNCFFSAAPYLSFSLYTSVILCGFYYVLCRKVESFEPVMQAVQSVFFVITLLIIVQCFGKDTLLNFNRPEPVVLGTIGNKMILGTFVTCLAPFLICYKKLNIIPVVLIAFISGSAGMVLSLAMGGIFYVLCRVKKKLVAIVLVCILLGSVAFYARHDNVVSSFGTNRRKIWKRTLELTMKHPFFGYGISTFRVIFPVLSGDIPTGITPLWEYEKTSGTWVPWRRAHNCWNQINFELGHIGFVLFLGLIGYLIWRFIKSPKTILVILAMSGLVVIGTNMTVHFPTRLPQTVLIIMCYLAFCERTMGTEESFWLFLKNLWKQRRIK